MPLISKGHKYVAILDAGSSGTRIYVYRYATSDDGRAIIPLELTLVRDLKSESTPPSLHQQRGLEQVGRHLRPLLRSAKDLLVDCGARNVPIYLIATQGMRDLYRGENGPEISMKILENAHEIMNGERKDRSDRTIFEIGHLPNELEEPDRSARIIEGNVEGLLAWVAVNHGFRGKPEDPTIAIFEIGGASAQIAFDNGPGVPTDPNSVKDVCLPSGRHHIRTISWENYGVDSMWRRLLPDSAAVGDHPHACLRPGETHEVKEGVTYTGTADTDAKWNDCLELIDPLITGPAVPNKAPTELFYGLGMPILGTLKGLDPKTENHNWFKNGRVLPVKYDIYQFVHAADEWCRTPYDANNEDQNTKISRQRCAVATWIVSLMGHENFYSDGLEFSDDFYIPSQREFPSRGSWTMGAAALIARAQMSVDPGLKGCVRDMVGLEVMGIFNGSTDSTEDTFVSPAVQPAFDDESYDEDFTNTPLTIIKSSHVPSSAKFINSLSDNNFMTAQLSLSFANFALIAVLLVAISTWVYRRSSRRASPNIILPGGDMMKL